jgi:ribonuclease HI
MEIYAAITGLETLKQPCRVRLFSDSEYLVKTMSLGWARRWKANGWMRNKKERALNPDLWERLLRQTAIHDVEFVWVRGHAGDPNNERCDRLSYEALRRRDLPVDAGYERAKDQS